MESGLIFNQLICEFESRHPCHDMTKVARINFGGLSSAKPCSEFCFVLLPSDTKLFPILQCALNFSMLLDQAPVYSSDPASVLGLISTQGLRELSESGEQVDGNDPEIRNEAHFLRTGSFSLSKNSYLP